MTMIVCGSNACRNDFPGTGEGATGESAAGFAVGLVARRRSRVARRAPAVVVAAADSRRFPAIPGDSRRFPPIPADSRRFPPSGFPPEPGGPLCRRMHEPSGTRSVSEEG